MSIGKVRPRLAAAGPGRPLAPPPHLGSPLRLRMPTPDHPQHLPSLGFRVASDAGEALSPRPPPRRPRLRLQLHDIQHSGLASGRRHKVSWARGFRWGRALGPFAAYRRGMRRRQQERREPPGPSRSQQEPAQSRQHLRRAAGAARSGQERPGATRSGQEPPGAARNRKEYALSTLSNYHHLF